MIEFFIGVIVGIYGFGYVISFTIAAFLIKKSPIRLGWRRVLALSIMCAFWPTVVAPKLIPFLKTMSSAQIPDLSGGGLDGWTKKDNDK